MPYSLSVEGTPPSRKSGAILSDRPLAVQYASGMSLLTKPAAAPADFDAVAAEPDLLRLPRKGRAAEMMRRFDARAALWETAQACWSHSQTADVIGRSNILEFYLDMDDGILMSLGPRTGDTGREQTAEE